MDLSAIFASTSEKSYKDFKNQLDTAFTLDHGCINRKEFFQVYFTNMVGPVPKISITFDDDEFIKQYEALINRTSLCENEYGYFQKILTLKDNSVLIG